MARDMTRTEPCPNCQCPHARGEYIDRPDLQKPGGDVPSCPPDVGCPCGATLRHTVPFFRTPAQGWAWKIVKPAGTPADAKPAK